MQSARQAHTQPCMFYQGATELAQPSCTASPHHPQSPTRVLASVLSPGPQVSSLEREITALLEPSFSLYMNELCLHVCLRTMCAWRSLRPEDSISVPGTELAHGYKLPCGCWEPNPGPLQEH